MQANEKGEMEAVCHCGTVRFRVKLTDGFNTARRCTCSYCRMRGAVAGSWTSAEQSREEDHSAGLTLVKRKAPNL